MNFTEKMAKYVISDMVDSTGKHMDFEEMVRTIKPKALHEELAVIASHHGRVLEHNCWDVLTCYAMAMADYPHSLDSDDRRKLWVVEYLTDVDASEDKLFKYFF